MAAVCGRALLAPLGGRLRACPRACPRAPLRPLTSAAPLYDVVVSGGGMVGSAMAAALGKAVTFSASGLVRAGSGDSVQKGEVRTKRESLMHALTVRALSITKGCCHKAEKVLGLSRLLGACLVLFFCVRFRLCSV